MSEDLTEYLRERDIKVEYLHSDVDAIERVEILRNLRAGGYDVIVGVNLLREGLDLPEVELVAVLDADKEGFLRSETSLVQTAGRAARHELGRVIFYADVMTRSLQAAWDVCQYRREKQLAYNQKHGITPKSVSRPVQESLRKDHKDDSELLTVSEKNSPAEVKNLIKQLEKEMFESVKKLEFEKAALLRDQISFLKDGSIPSKKTSGRKRKYGNKGR
jgi:excinuclease ABC subunit B